MMVGGAIGAIAARAVAMTSMPEMVALFQWLRWCGIAAGGLVGALADAGHVHTGDDRAVDPDRRRDLSRARSSHTASCQRRSVAVRLPSLASRL